ncbi:magnesium transporter MRS2-3-like isoform X2 [Phaseolus vulgaris]|uniref:magnesium transporter MRS2-3-like isoform X2 n=1 Tax=Phaseolus vulgaris TaxID=3885 RepID=UPI0035CB4E1B
MESKFRMWKRGREKRQTTEIRKKERREWLLLDGKGKMELVEAGNDAIIKRTGLPACDLRKLDPLLSYPSILLGCERAVVINLEHVKAVITVQTVLLFNSRDPSITLFVHELQAWILRHHQDSSSSKHHVHPDAINILPFELVALEGCLRSACNKLVKDEGQLDDVEKLHTLLETYFVQMDGTLNKLWTEYLRKKEADIIRTRDYQHDKFYMLGLILCTASLVLDLSLKEYLRKKEADIISTRNYQHCK